VDRPREEDPNARCTGRPRRGARMNGPARRWAGASCSEGVGESRTGGADRGNGRRIISGRAEGERFLTNAFGRYGSTSDALGGITSEAPQRSTTDWVMISRRGLPRCRSVQEIKLSRLPHEIDGRGGHAPTWRDAVGGGEQRGQTGKYQRQRARVVCSSAMLTGQRRWKHAFLIDGRGESCWDLGALGRKVQRPAPTAGERRLWRSSVGQYATTAIRTHSARFRYTKAWDVDLNTLIPAGPRAGSLARWRWTSITWVRI
jgi:hypothetical protein